MAPLELSQIFEKTTARSPEANEKFPVLILTGRPGRFPCSREDQLHCVIMNSWMVASSYDIVNSPSRRPRGGFRIIRVGVLAADEYLSIARVQILLCQNACNVPQRQKHASQALMRRCATPIRSIRAFYPLHKKYKFRQHLRGPIIF
jgi:hypothetical protein